MIEGQHFQNAYITRDVDKAVADFEARTGLECTRRFEGPVEFKTPRGPGTGVYKIAFIWSGKLQYELIQPISGMVDVHRDPLPADDSLKFHHVCMRVDNWETFRAKVERQKYPVVLESSTDVMKFLYMDARDFVGHYLEYLWVTPEMWTMMGGQ